MGVLKQPSRQLPLKYPHTKWEGDAQQSGAECAGLPRHCPLPPEPNPPSLAQVLATSIFNAAGLSILTGLAAAMETFCGQVGARREGGPLLRGSALGRKAGSCSAPSVKRAPLLPVVCSCFWGQLGARGRATGHEQRRTQRPSSAPAPHTHTRQRTPLPSPAQAFGAGAYRLVGVVLQRALILTVLVVAAVGSLLSRAGPILKAVGQDPAIAAGALV